MAMLNNQMVIHQVMIQRAATGPLPDMAMRCYMGYPTLVPVPKQLGFMDVLYPPNMVIKNRQQPFCIFLH